MAVSPDPGNKDSVALNTKVTAVQTALAAAPVGSTSAVALTKALAQAQSELVLHYVAAGRVSPAAVLSTIGTPPDGDSNSLALASRVTSLATAVSAAVAGSASQKALTVALAAAQNDLLNHYAARGRISAATVLSTMS